MTQPKPVYKRGDVALVLFPHSNLKTAKVRPVLVVQADDIQTGLPQLIVAMITSRMFRANHSYGEHRDFYQRNSVSSVSPW